MAAVCSRVSDLRECYRTATVRESVPGADFLTGPDSDSDARG